MSKRFGIAKITEIMQILLVLFALCSLYIKKLSGEVNFTLIFSCIMFLMAVEAILKEEVNLRAKIITKQNNAVLYIAFIAFFLFVAVVTFYFGIRS